MSRDVFSRYNSGSVGMSETADRLSKRESAPRERNGGLPIIGRFVALWSESTPVRRGMMAGGAASFLAGAVLLIVGLTSLGGGGGAPPKGPPVVDLGVDSSFLRATHSPTVVPSPTGPTPTPAPPLGDSPYRIIIEKIGVEAPVDTYGLDENAVPEVPTGDDAAQVVAWYNFSARPGTGSNAVFAGHVTWFGPAVFYSLTSVAPGDIIKLRNDEGTELVYKVTSVFSVDPNDPDSLKVMHGTDKDVITIITCDGAFTDTNDPVFGGEYSSRLVVRGELANVNVAGAAQPPSAGG